MIAQSVPNRRRNLRGFLLLVAVVVIGAAVLKSQGDLINPLESTELLINVSSGGDGFAMVGEERTPPDTAASVSQSSMTASAASSADVAAGSGSSGDQVAATGTLTLETLTAELAAAGVDVEAVSADMSAQGRSLENLLIVVNSGRVTVADLAARLKSESSSAAPAQPEAVPDQSVSTGLFDVHWDEFGSVLYDLWFILAVTVAVIIIARPAGWLVKRMKRAQ